MILQSAIIGIVAIALLLFLRSHKLMNIVSLAHAASYVGFAAYYSYLDNLPIYFFGNKYLFIDNFALFQVMIASGIFFIAILYLEGYLESLIESKELASKYVKLFYLCVNLLLICINFSFFSNNLALFWAMLELTTVFSAVLIVILNAKDNIYAAMKYVFVCSTAMLFAFVGLILLYAFTQLKTGTGTLNWDELMLSANLIPSNLALAAFIFIFIGFGAKAAVAPFHTWVIHAHSKAPSAVSALLSGVVINVGVYGIIRVSAIMYRTGASHAISSLLLFFGIVSMAIAGFSMLQQDNTKKFIAFSSVEHTGFILIGVAIASKLSLFWVMIYMLANSLAKSLLFLCAGIANRQYEGNNVNLVKNFIKFQPLASVIFVMGILAIVGMPPFALFFPKIFILLMLGKLSLPIVALVLLLVLVSTSSFIIFFTRFFSSNDKDVHIEKYKIPMKMKISIIVLAILIIAFGIFIPDGLNYLATKAVENLGIGGLNE